MMSVRDMMSTLGVFSTPGYDGYSTPGYHDECVYHDECAGYDEYTGSVQYTGI